MGAWSDWKERRDEIRKKIAGHSRLQKISGLFREEEEKERVLSREDFTATDTYYATVSVRYRITERIAVVCLVVFLVFSLFLNLRQITYGNFFYFFRDFGNAVDRATPDGEFVPYDVHNGQRFALFRGGFAAMSPAGVTVYSATGRSTVKNTSSWVKPFAVTSDKYLLVYDMGDGKFSLFNSFAKVFTETLDESVQDAAISPSGVFAAVTSSGTHRTVIRVYSKNFNLVGQYKITEYCNDVALSADGKRMAVLLYDLGDGRGRTRVRLYDIDPESSRPAEERMLFESEAVGECPLALAVFSNGKIGVATDTSVMIFDGSGEMFERVAAEGNVLATYAGEYGVCAAYATGTLHDRTLVIAFDEKGNYLYEDVAVTSCDQIEICEDYIFIRDGAVTERLNTANGEEIRKSAEEGQMLVCDEDTVIVCTASGARTVRY